MPPRADLDYEVLSALAEALELVTLSRRREFVVRDLLARRCRLRERLDQLSAAAAANRPFIETHSSRSTAARCATSSIQEYDYA